MRCSSCGKKFSGSGLSLTLDGEEKVFCAECYGRIKEDYSKKRNCDDCAHFEGDSCELTGIKLAPTSIGYNDYFIQAVKCDYYKKIDRDQEGIDSLEKQGRYDEAVEICEELGQTEKAEHLKRKQKEQTAQREDVDSLIVQLVEKGQTLTYYCCHCGAPLKLGKTTEEMLKVCPNCGLSLEAVDMAKLIRRHLK